MAGHSLGEYCAAAAAGCMDTRQALELVWARGRAMLEASRANPGGMLALVGVGPREAEELLAACVEEGEARVANHNASTQVVVAGGQAGLGKVREEAARRGVRVMPLGVSGPFHTPAMREAQAKVEEHLRGMEMKDPAVPFFSGYTGGEVESGAEVGALPGGGDDLPGALVRAPGRTGTAGSGVAGGSGAGTGHQPHGQAGPPRACASATRPTCSREGRR